MESCFGSWTDNQVVSLKTLLGILSIGLPCIVCDLRDLVIEDIDYKFFVHSKFWFVVDAEIGHFIYENYNISTKMICLDHGSGDF